MGDDQNSDQGLQSEVHFKPPHSRRLVARPHRGAEGVLTVKLAETPQEWAQIRFLFNEWGEPLPDPARSFVAIAVDPQRRVIGLQVMQFVLHAEPLWVALEWRGKFNVLRLIDALENHLSSILSRGYSYFIMATRKNVEKLAALAGMQIVGPGVMFRKDVALGDENEENEDQSGGEVA